MSDPHQHLAHLLIRIAAGDRQAFADFFDATYPIVASWADRADTSDFGDELVIAAYLRVWTHAPSFPRSSQSVTEWLAATTAPALSIRTRKRPAKRARRFRLRLPIVKRRWAKRPPPAETRAL